MLSSRLEEMQEGAFLSVIPHLMWNIKLIHMELLFNKIRIKLRMTDLLI